MGRSLKPRCIYELDRDVGLAAELGKSESTRDVISASQDFTGFQGASARKLFLMQCLVCSDCSKDASTYQEPIKRFKSSFRS